MALLAVLLRQHIRAGTYGPGDRLPDETQLVRDLGVSRTALRAVLAELAEEGLVQRRRGQGTFVSARQITHRAHASPGLLRSLARQRLSGRHELRSSSVWSMDPVTSALFGAAVGTSMFLIERVTRVEETPVQFATYVVRADLAPGMLAPDLVDAALDMRVWLDQALHTPIETVEWLMEAVTADERLAEMLDCAPGAAVIRKTRYFHGSGDELLAYGSVSARGDRLVYQGTSQARSDPVARERLR